MYIEAVQRVCGSCESHLGAGTQHVLLSDNWHWFESQYPVQNLFKLAMYSSCVMSMPVGVDGGGWISPFCMLHMG